MADMAMKTILVQSSTLLPININTSESVSAVNDTVTQQNYAIQMSAIAQISAMSAMDPLSHVGDGVFLQTKTAQGLAGIFVWVALFITCQQVFKLNIIFYIQIYI